MSDAHHTPPLGDNAAPSTYDDGEAYNDLHGNAALTLTAALTALGILALTIRRALLMGAAVRRMHGEYLRR